MQVKKKNQHCMTTDRLWTSWANTSA